MQFRSNNKLAAKYYGPFKVIVAEGKAAYKLQLPRQAKIHNVFHVSQLKTFHGELPHKASITTWAEDNIESLFPAAILDKRVLKRGTEEHEQLLVQWRGNPIHEASWMDVAEFEAQFPEFSAET